MCVKEIYNFQILCMYNYKLFIMKLILETYAVSANIWIYHDIFDKVKL